MIKKKFFFKFPKNFFLTILFFFSLLVFFTQKLDFLPTDSIKAKINDVSFEALNFFVEPIKNASSFYALAKNTSGLYLQNRELERKISEMKYIELQYKYLKRENDELRAQLKFHSESEFDSIFVTTYNDSSTPFVKSALVNAGKKDGVKEDYAVITSSGLVGRIIQAGSETSRILLLNDLNSRIPVVIYPSKTRAILRGDNTTSPYLAFFSGNTTFEIGDVVFTSGKAGIIPPGIPVGIVSEVNLDESRVELFSNDSSLGNVRIIKYSMPQLQYN